PLLRPYLIAVAIAGGCTLVAGAIGAVRTPHPIAWLALAAIAVATGSFKANVAATSAQIAIDDTFYIAIAILFGPGPATIPIALSAFILPVRRRRPLRMIVFNTASLALLVWVGARFFVLAVGVESLASSHVPMY